MPVMRLQLQMGGHCQTCYFVNSTKQSTRKAIPMNVELTVMHSNDGAKIDVSYRLDDGGKVTIEVQTYLWNPTLSMLQAVACERAAEKLSTLAREFRQQTSSTQDQRQEAAEE